MKKIKRIACLIFVVILSVTVLAPAAPANAGKLTNDSIREKEDQIKESEKIKKQIQSNISDAKKIKKELESLKTNVAEYIEELDGQLVVIQDNIDCLKGMITDKEKEIEITSQELDEAIATEEAQYKAMKERIKMMYEQGAGFYLDIMLSATSFGDFLTKADYVDQLEAYDRKMLNQYQETREYTALCKATLESEKSTLDDAKAAAEEEEENLQLLLAEKETELANYKRDIASKEAQIADYQSKYEEEVAVIEQLEKQIEKEKQELLRQNGATIYDGGTFAWPCPAYTRITDEYGWRTDPITGASSYHSGLDLGAPGGSNILAAYDGVVVAATYNWSMGNYVMIDHGGGLYTIYMHSSKLYVNVNDIVVKGQTIAAVGTTGRSTGNHLHFGVRLNGSYVSPWNYLK